MARFKSYHAAPPGGKYFFRREGVYVEDKTVPGISLKVKRLFAAAGETPPFNPFELVMDFMAPYMPPEMVDGYDGPLLTTLSVDELKENTGELFGLPAASPVSIRERLHTCMVCPENDRTLCPACGEFTQWALDGVGSRTRMEADDRVSVCRVSRMFIPALVSVNETGDAPEGSPDTCWRVT